MSDLTHNTATTPPSATNSPPLSPLLQRHLISKKRAEEKRRERYLAARQNRRRSRSAPPATAPTPSARPLVSNCTQTSVAAETSLLGDDLSASIDDMAVHIASWMLEQTACSDIEAEYDDANDALNASIVPEYDDASTGDAPAIENQLNASLAPEYDDDSADAPTPAKTTPAFRGQPSADSAANDAGEEEEEGDASAVEEAAEEAAEAVTGVAEPDPAQSEAAATEEAAAVAATAQPEGPRRIRFWVAIVLAMLLACGCIFALPVPESTPSPADDISPAGIHQVDTSVAVYTRPSCAPDAVDRWVQMDEEEEAEWSEDGESESVEEGEGSVGDEGGNALLQNIVTNSRLVTVANIEALRSGQEQYLQAMIELSKRA